MSFGSARSLGVCAAVAALELWLAWPDEIVARPNPYDQLRYLGMAEQIAAGHWLGEYGILTLVREPGYPLWLAAVHASGVPLRLANELLTLLAAGVLCAALRRIGVSRGVAAGAFALLVLQPHGYLVARDVLPASFYGALGWLTLAGFAWSLVGGRWRIAHLAWTGVVLGLMVNTRPESPLIWAWVVGLMGLDGTVGRAAGARFGRSAGALGVWGAGIVVVTAAFAALNYAHYGVFRVTDSRAPGFAAANRALLSIEQASPQRFVPVPAEARARAYAVSPAFARLESRLEGPSWARSASCRIDKICDDIGAGYFRWALREAAFDAGSGQSASELDADLARIAAEIDAACESGKLRCHPPPAWFLHPESVTYRSHLFDSLRRVFGRIAHTGELRDRRPPRDAPKLSDAARRRFDDVANRRPELTQKRPAEDGAREHVRDALWVAHAVWVWCATVVGVAGLVALLVLRRRSPLADPQTAVIGAMAMLVGGRLALLTLVDASSFAAWSSRYVYPIASLYGVAALLLAHRAWRQWRLRPPASRPSHTPATPC